MLQRRKNALEQIWRIIAHQKHRNLTILYWSVPRNRNSRNNGAEICAFVTDDSSVSNKCQKYILIWPREHKGILNLQCHSSSCNLTNQIVILCLPEFREFFYANIKRIIINLIIFNNLWILWPVYNNIYFYFQAKMPGESFEKKFLFHWTFILRIW